MENKKKQTFLEKYGIPVDHLDFKYINECRKIKEMEKIVQILKSGEEGYYPDLTICAENKLIELCPNNKLLRVEEPIKRKHAMNSDEWHRIQNSMKEFTEQIKEENESILEDNRIESNLPDIRTLKNPDENKNSVAENQARRIGSCDYREWDKYDADTEEMKIDLMEEKNREQNEILKKQKAKIEVIQPSIIEHLSTAEREKLAEKHRILGNESFKLSDNEEAIREYSKSIDIHPTAASFNNRAMAHIKLKKYTNAIMDCDQCLQIEPENVKALLRKADALLKMDKARDAYETYNKVLTLDADNRLAKKIIDEIKVKMPELAPSNATRLKIQEDDIKTSNDNQVKQTAEYLNEDLSKLIIPKKIIKSKLSQMASNLDGIKKAAKDNLKQMKNNLNEKRDIQILPKPSQNKQNNVVYPRQHDDNKWNGAFIEEIFV